MREVVQAFTPEQEAAVATELTELTKMLSIGGVGKVEEDHWSSIYCKVKGIPKPTWSNREFRDVIHAGLGIESKLLKRPSPFADAGRALMHPAATRKIAFDPRDPADVCMTTVLTQWGELIEDFRTRVAATSPIGTADTRFGILLWGETHREFLYYEERIDTPNPSDYFAQWSEGTHRGKPSRNLHIFEKATGQKRYSATLPENGAKLQPYFDIPTYAQGAHFFSVPKHDLVPIWVPREMHSKILQDIEQRFGQRQMEEKPDALLEDDPTSNGD